MVNTTLSLWILAREVAPQPMMVNLNFIPYIKLSLNVWTNQNHLPLENLLLKKLKLVGLLTVLTNVVKMMVKHVNNT
jgi:hypothetical protein